MSAVIQTSPAKPTGAKTKASDLFVRCLEEEGIEYIFGVPGEENADFMMSLEASAKIKFVLTRHEQGAAFMAEVYGRLTGNPAGCLGTLGPGATNLITGVANSNMDRSPMLVLTGQGATTRLHKESHQIMDVVEMFKPVTKWATSILHATTIPEIVRKAVRVARTEKPGAVLIELPEDVAKQQTDVLPLSPKRFRRSVPDDKIVDQAFDLIRNARRPVIIAGNGCIRKRASKQLRRLCNQTGIGVISTFMAKGAVDLDAEYCLYTIGLGTKDRVNLAIDDADRVMCKSIDWLLQRTTSLGQPGPTELLQMPGGYSVAEHTILAGNDFDRITLSDLCSNRRRFLILGIEHDDGSYLSAPDLGTRLATGDRVVLYGSDEEHALPCMRRSRQRREQMRRASEHAMQVRVPMVAALMFTLSLAGCATKLQSPDLGGIYNDLIQSEDPYRNSVIVVPGILGSKLKDVESNTVVWGAFGADSANPKKPDAARLVALPMGEGIPLAALLDDVQPDGVLDQVKVRFAGLDLRLKAYFYMLSTLGAAYRDSELGESGAIEYGEGHYTCFQFAYDWRRDIVESARLLHEFILKQRAYVQVATEKQYGIKNLDVKFDIVAHSMGGLVARYYLRYGPADLPSDGSLPTLTWEGAKYVENVVLVGTPNAGSVDAIGNLVEGRKFAPLMGAYEPAILGTMPAVYQLLPRGRHGAMINAGTAQRIEDIHDPELWERMNWGLADPRQDKVLQMLLPEVHDVAARRRIALDHQRKALRRAGQFAAALDLPASPPPGLSIYLIAGDAVSTDAVVAINSDDGAVHVIKEAPGDGTVLRSSALMDEGIGTDRVGRLDSPIDWTSVHFLFRDHIGLTKDPGFSDNLLYFLFEKPK